MTTRSLLLAGAALVLLTGCGDDKTPEAAVEEKRIYGSLDACLDDAASMDDVKFCRESYAKAQEKMASAPSYDGQSKCEDVFGAGNCVPRAAAGGGGVSSWIPAVVGFMVGRELAGGTPRTYSEPVYRDRSGQMYTPTYGRLDIPPQPPEERRAQSSGGGGSSWSSGSWTSGSSSGESKSGSSKSIWKSTSSGSGGGSIWTSSSSSRGSSGKAYTTSSSVSRGGFGSTASSHASAGG